MKKTLEQILAEAREQAEKTVSVIDKLIAESKRAGVVWPELEDNIVEIDGEKYREVEKSSCDGCAFSYINCIDLPSCYKGSRDDNTDVIFVKVESTETKK